MTLDNFENHEIDDIEDLINTLRWFREYEKRHYYHFGWCNFTETIRILNGEIKKKKMDFKKKYGYLPRMK